MTKNQIDYAAVKVEQAKLEEERRHNLATEGMTAEHYARADTASMMQAEASQAQAEVAKAQIPINQMNATTNRMSIEESMRHNLQTEQETVRHDVANERLAQSEVAEKIRHNVELENQGWAQIAETHRHATATELLGSEELREKAYHNRVAESQGWAEINVSKESVKVRQQEADVKQQEANTHFKAFVADTANEAIKRQQDKRRLDIMEKQASKPEQTINITNNDNDSYGVPNTITTTPSNTNGHSNGGGHFSGDSDDGPFEKFGHIADDIVDVVNNFLTGGKLK